MNFVNEFKKCKPNQNYRPPASVAAPCEQITIPVAEYIYLQRVAALMEALLQADTYNSTQVLESVKRTVRDMRGGTEAGAEE